MLASKLIAQAAMEKGLDAHSAETIGMAQRGGGVVSHVRFGGTMHSPLIPYGMADVIIGFEPGETVRMLPYLKQGGVVVVCPDPIQPVTASLGIGHYDGERMLPYLKGAVEHLIVVDGKRICEICGSPKVLNTALLGAAAASGMLGLTLEEMESAVLKRVPEKLREMNRKALQLGAETYARET